MNQIKVKVGDPAVILVASGRTIEKKVEEVNGSLAITYKGLVAKPEGNKKEIVTVYINEDGTVNHISAVTIIKIVEISYPKSGAEETPDQVEAKSTVEANLRKLGLWGIYCQRCKTIHSHSENSLADYFAKHDNPRALEDALDFSRTEEGIVCWKSVIRLLSTM